MILRDEDDYNEKANKNRFSPTSIDSLLLLDSFATVVGRDDEDEAKSRPYPNDGDPFSSRIYSPKCRSTRNVLE